MQCPTNLRSNKHCLSVMRAISYLHLVVQEEILSRARNQSLFLQDNYIRGCVAENWRIMVAILP